MAEKLEEELDQLTDEEIEARLAAAVWVDDKRAAVLRYLEEKKLGKKKEARSAEFEIARNAKEAAGAAASLAKEANWRANLAITIASVAAAAAVSAAIVVILLGANDARLLRWDIAVLN
jgi:serine phosphatase RsbU (regulator of sigma subunit)